MPAKLTMSAAQRLRRNADFVDIRRNGKTYRCPYFALFSRIRATEVADVSVSRIGISAARRVGKANIRNLAKRRFRELYRLHQHIIRPEAEMVVSIRQPATKASWEELEKRFLHALKYCRLLFQNKEP